MDINVSTLRGKMVERGHNTETISSALGIGRSSFYRKIKRGGDFTIVEVHEICKTLSLSKEEAIEIFLPQYSQ